MSVKKKLRLFCGPNGSGKSSLYEEFKKHNYNSGVYINSDEIEKAIQRGNTPAGMHISIAVNEILEFLEE